MSQLLQVDAAGPVGPPFEIPVWDPVEAGNEQCFFRFGCRADQSIVRNPKDGSLLVLVPGGPFLVGGTRFQDEGHGPFVVELAAFWLGLTPVTNQQYLRFVTATGHRCPDKASHAGPAWDGGSFPANLKEHPSRTNYKPRMLARKLHRLSGLFPVVVFAGTKQVGKTTLLGTGSRSPVEGERYRKHDLKPDSEPDYEPEK